MPPLSRALQRRRQPPEEPAFDRLLRAARELFTEEGFAATSLDAVAERAGVTKGSLYHHFDGKADLFEAVFEAAAIDLAQQVADVLGAVDDPWEASLAGVRAYLEKSQQPYVQQIMLMDAPSVLGWGRVREIDAEYGLALVKAALQSLRDDGTIADHDLDTLAHLVFGLLIEASLLIAQSPDPDARRASVEREARAVLEGLRARA